MILLDLISKKYWVLFLSAVFVLSFPLFHDLVQYNAALHYVVFCVTAKMSREFIVRVSHISSIASFDFLLF